MRLTKSLEEERFPGRAAAGGFPPIAPTTPKPPLRIGAGVAVDEDVAGVVRHGTSQGGRCSFPRQSRLWGRQTRWPGAGTARMCRRCLGQNPVGGVSEAAGGRKAPGDRRGADAAQPREEPSPDSNRGTSRPSPRFPVTASRRAQIPGSDPTGSARCRCG
jgi:hypothetical protein